MDARIVRDGDHVTGVYPPPYYPGVARFAKRWKMSLVLYDWRSVGGWRSVGVRVVWR